MLGFVVAMTLQSEAVFALSNSEIASQTQAFTVQINGKQTGTGTTIEKSGNTYKVLTCWHVVDEPGEYEIITRDGKTHQATQIYNLPGVDLAIVEFDSTNSYQMAELGNSETAIPGESAYTAGYPDPFPGFPERSYTFLGVSIISKQQKGDRGYQIIYNNPSPPGSSGGGIFDNKGRLIGVNGRVISEGNTSNTYGAGIPLQVYLASRDNLVLNIGQNKLRARDYKGALEEMDRAINRNPDLIDAYIERAKVFSQVGRYSEAIKDLNYVLKNDLENVIAYSYRGLNYSYLEEYKKAFADHEKAIDLNPDLDLVYANRGLSYLNLKGVSLNKDEGIVLISSSENLKKAILDLTESIYRGSDLNHNDDRDLVVNQIDKLTKELEKSLQNIPNLEIEDYFKQIPQEIVSSSIAKEKQVKKLTILGDNFSYLGYLEISDSTLQRALKLDYNLQVSNESDFNILMSLGKNQEAFSQERQNKFTPLSIVIDTIENKKWRNAKAKKTPFQEALSYYKKAAKSSTSETDFLKAEISYLNLLIDNKKFLEKTISSVSNNIDIVDIADGEFLEEILDNIKDIESDLAKEIEPKINVSTQTVYSRIADLPLTDVSVDLLIDFSQILVRLGQNDADAIKISETAISKARELNNIEGEAFALANIALLHEQKQDLKKAEQFTRKGLDLVSQAQYPRITSQLHRLLGRLLTTQGNLTEGVIEYEDSFAQIKAFSDEFKITEIESIGREYVSILLLSNPSAFQLQKAREVMEFIKVADVNTSFLSTIGQNKDSVLIDEIDPKAAVIYPIVLQDRIELIATLPGQSLRHYTIQNVTQDKVNNTVKALHRLLATNPGFAEAIRIARGSDNAQNEIATIKKTQEESLQQDILPLASELYSWLIEPIEQDLEKSRVENLVFVLDDSLRNIPMSMLHDANNGKYLIEQDYNIAVSPGLYLTAPSPLKRQSIKVLAAGVTRDFPQYRFPPIPKVEDELKTIKSIFGESKILLNQDFTEASLQQELQESDYSVVHLATHSQFGSTYDQTFILSGAEEGNALINGNHFDYLLRAGNLRRSQPLELLVLSLDGTNKVFDDRRNYGFAGIAIGSGVKSTISSLWGANDEATSDLMGKFYRNLAADAKISKAAALRKAQIELLADEDSPYRHPYYWASFVLWGNWL